MHRAGCLGQPVRMQDVAEQLEAVDQARAGTREVGGGVDGHDAAGAERGELVCVGPGLLERAVGVVAARHDDHDLGLRGAHVVPRALRGVLAGQAEHVEAAGVLDQLRRPVAGHEHRVQPLERGDADGLGGAHGQAHAVDPRGGVLHERHAGVLGVGRLRQRAYVAEHLAERAGVERQHLRRGSMRSASARTSS